MKNFSTILLAATMLFMTSCATIFTGTRDSITFNSTPSGATIYIDGVEQCKTPCTLDVKRSFDDTVVEFRLDGYETRLITLSNEFNLVSILNLGSLVGWGIDFLTGAIMKYDRRAYDITLDKKQTSMINPLSIHIDTQNNIVDIYVAEN